MSNIGMTFDEYVALHRRALLRFAAVLSVDPSGAEDIVAEVLARAFSNWAQIEKADSIHAYVRKMVLHEYLKTQRLLRRISYRSDLSELGLAEDDHSAAHADRAELVQELKRLPPRQRAAVVLRYYEGLSFTEIAALLGTGENAVRSNVSRALAALRIQLSDAEPEARPSHRMKAL